MKQVISTINRVPKGWRRSVKDQLRIATNVMDKDANISKKDIGNLINPNLFINPNPCVPVNSGAGRIQYILLTPASVYFNGAPYWLKSYEAFFYNLISHMGPDRHYIVLCNKGREKWVMDKFEKAGIPESNITKCHSVFDISVWTQDPFMATTAQDGSSILYSDVLYSVGKDQTIAPDVTMQVEGIDFNYSYLFFIGGNSLVSRDYLLLGKDFVLTNLGRKYLENIPTILKAFEISLNMKTLCIGTEKEIPGAALGSSEGESIFDQGMFQPIFHLDMFLTITGDIDPETDKEIVLIGRPSLAQKILNDPSDIYHFDKYFEEIEKQLTQYFVVKQLPIYPTTSIQTYPGNQGNLSYYLTYNNVVLENYFDEDLGKQVKTVYLTQYYNPQYPFKPRGGQEVRKVLDKAAAEIWTSLGFKIKPIPNMEIFASGNGSVHCMQKTLGRKLKYSKTKKQS